MNEREKNVLDNVLDIALYKESFHYYNGHATVLANYKDNSIMIRSTMLPKGVSLKLPIDTYDEFDGSMKDFVIDRVYIATKRTLKNK